MSITFIDFFRAFKLSVNEAFAKEKSLCSDSDKINFLFEPLIKTKNIKNKNGDLLYLDKSRTSLILTAKERVPKAISNEYHFLKTNADIKKDYLRLFKSSISSSQIETLLNILEIQNVNGYVALYDCFVDALLNDDINPNKNLMVIWEKGCNSINFVSGNIFEHCFKRRPFEEIIVIPVNTKFDVHVSTKSEKIKPLVSNRTLHGKWIERCANSNIKEMEIKNNILESLSVQYPEKSIKSGYPIGTVVPYNTKMGITYLLAVSTFDENNVAHSSSDEISWSIKKLIEFYDVNGQGYSLYIPLIGTGRSRANLSYKESFKLISDELIKNCNRIHGTVNIIALPEIYEKIKETVDAN